MLHVDGSHTGPDGCGQQGRCPAKHQVQPVVVGGVVQENIDHQNIVKVQALEKRKSLHFRNWNFKRCLLWNILFM